MPRTVKTALDPNRPRVPALSKSIGVLRYLNASPRLSASLTEISAALEVTKSHCFNILRTFEAEGWVRFDSESRRYHLSARLLTDLSRLLAKPARAEGVHEELVRLSIKTRLPCVLTRIDADGSFIAIDKAEDAAELIVSVPLGHRFPADAPAQMRVRLAWAHNSERKQALATWKPVAYTATTITDRSELLREIEKTRVRGYAISRAEYSPGVTTLAAPIFNSSGQVVRILQCPGLDTDIPNREREVAEPLMEAAELIGTLIDSQIG
jgi:DNA-binding IclR family transcriptional regulator